MSSVVSYSFLIPSKLPLTSSTLVRYELSEMFDLDKFFDLISKSSTFVCIVARVTVVPTLLRNVYVGGSINPLWMGYKVRMQGFF